jgi:hypothetical protein
MYYLLGYRLLGQCEDRLQALYRMVEEDPRKRKHKRHVAQGEEVHIYYKDVLGPKLLLEVISESFKLIIINILNLLIKG